MQVSDFDAAKNLHHLLWMILYSETGLRGTSVSTPENQLIAVNQAFVPLRANILEMPWDKERQILKAGDKEIPISYESEADLFVLVYDLITHCQGQKISEASIASRVFPIGIRNMIRNYPILIDVINDQLKEDEAKHGKAVGNRIRESLKGRFGISGIE